MLIKYFSKLVIHFDSSKKLEKQKCSVSNLNDLIRVLDWLVRNRAPRVLSGRVRRLNE